MSSSSHQKYRRDRHTHSGVPIMLISMMLWGVSAFAQDSDAASFPDDTVTAVTIVPELTMRAEPVTQGVSIVRRIPLGEELVTAGETQADGDRTYLRVMDRDGRIGWVDERFMPTAHESAVYVENAFLYDRADLASLVESLRMPAGTILAVSEIEEDSGFYPSVWFDQEAGVIRREYAKASDVSLSEQDVLAALVIATVEGLEVPDAQRAVLSNLDASGSAFESVIVEMRRELRMDGTTDIADDDSADMAGNAPGTDSDPGITGADATMPERSDLDEFIAVVLENYGVLLEELSASYELLSVRDSEGGRIYAPVYDAPLSSAAEYEWKGEDYPLDYSFVARTVDPIDVDGFETQRWWVVSRGDELRWVPGASVLQEGR